ncbi:MAG TPA: oligoendopeptidase F, partial [Symbiobacteriaceae bacterium]|nr:oligoendopeptidase F [Symbiobacteriaceae bacterium]
MSARLTRAQVKIEETWNLDDLFPSNEAWEKGLAACEAALPTVTQYQGRLAESAATLRDALGAQEKLTVQFIRVMTYASLRNSEDGTSPANQGMMARIQALGAKFNAATTFFKSEILAMPVDTVEAWIAGDAELAVFANNLRDTLADKPYTLSPETEKVLASFGEVFGAPYMTYLRSRTSDMQFASFTDAEGNEQANSFNGFEGGWEIVPEVATRHAAWESFVNGLRPYQNTYSATWATEVKKNVVMAKVRGFGSAQEMLIHGQRVTMDAYNNLLDVIQTELSPHMRRYANLKKRVLGLDKMKWIDLKAPLDPTYSPATNFDAARDIILEALSPLGDEYCAGMKRALTERWCDLPDNVGKGGGAFCSSPYGVHPFILITWKNSMRDVFTMAHELGHAGHFLMAQKYQRYVNNRPSTFFIEAPSTMNEMFLGQHLLKGSTDPRFRRWVIMQFLGTYYHNYVTHILEGELQRRIYNLAETGAPITAVTLSTTKGQILSDFWGDTVEIDEGAKLTWMRQPHYYMGLYPYTYSAGLTCSTAAMQQIQAEGQPAI